MNKVIFVVTEEGKVQLHLKAGDMTPNQAKTTERILLASKPSIPLRIMLWIEGLLVRLPW